MDDSSRGIPPPPITRMTLEQEFQLKKLEVFGEGIREDIITVFMALQEQCYVLSNNVKQLVMKW